MAYRPQTPSFVFSLAASLGFVCGAGGVIFLAGPAAADVKAGVDAWGAGDYISAVEEWREPAENGDAHAIFNLAQAYRLGRGVEADLGKARELYKDAADKGHIKAKDNYGLLLFQQGEQANAMPLISDAAERGDPRAQYVLGLTHFNADYSEKDWVRAYALLIMSEKSGLPQASKALAQMDLYVPLAQREAAQAITRGITAEELKSGKAQLAVVDLPAPTPDNQRPVSAQLSEVAREVESPVEEIEPPIAPKSGTASDPVRTAELPSQKNAPVAQTPAPPVAIDETKLTGGNWRIQLGAFGIEGNAARLWSELENNPILDGTDMALIPAGKVTKLQAVGFASKSEASKACSSLQSQGRVCIVARP